MFSYLAEAILGKDVLYLEYEAYLPMALRILESRCQIALSRWNLKKIAIRHRLGRVHVGEISVAIFVSAAHRKGAFEAVEFLIEGLKATVPIWKREHYSDGSVWKENKISSASMP